MNKIEEYYCQDETTCYFSFINVKLRYFTTYIEVVVDKSFDLEGYIYTRWSWSFNSDFWAYSTGQKKQSSYKHMP